MTPAMMVGAAAAALFVAMGVYLRPLRPNIVRIQLTFSESAFRAVHETWSGEARRRFAAHFRVDDLFLVLYGLFGWLLAAEHAAGHPSVSGAGALAWLLPAAALCDAIENRLHRRFIATAPGALAAQWFPLAGAAASAKWLAILAFIALLLAR